MNIKEVWTTTPSTFKVYGGLALALIIGAGIMLGQRSCGKRHEVAATHAGEAALNFQAEVYDLKNQLAGKEKVIEDLKAQGRTFKTQYETAKAKIPTAPLPPPVSDTELASGLTKLGLRDDLEVHLGVPSVLNTQDASTVWSLGQQAARAKSLEEALAACDTAEKGQEAIVQAQASQIELSARALQASQAEANARAVQAKEIGRALKIEKAKGWQKYGYAAAGVAITLLVRK